MDPPGARTCVLGQSPAPEPARRLRTPSALVDVAALCTALVALVMSFLAWTRPFPADPRNIPHHGDPAVQLVLDSDALVAEFFDFLEKEKEGRIYLNVAIPMDRAEHHKPHEPAENDPDPGGFLLESDPLTLLLQIHKTNEEGRQGLYFAHGAHHLKGYFANNGMVDISTGVAVYRITPLTDLEALSP